MNGIDIDLDEDFLERTYWHQPFVALRRSALFVPDQQNFTCGLESSPQLSPCDACFHNRFLCTRQWFWVEVSIP